VTIRWSDEARKSLRAIKKFIAQGSEFYAALTVAKIVDRVELAAQMPARGHRVHEYPERDLREVHEGSYRIIYSFTSEQLDVLTVIHFRKKLTKDSLKTH
jgi:plasmid stabilization system protein ParE